MANTDRDANDNAATDSGNADTKPAATAIEPGNKSTAHPVDDDKVEHKKPDTASEPGVDGTDPDPDKTPRPAKTERLGNEKLRGHLGGFGQRQYGQPHHNGLPPQGTDPDPDKTPRPAKTERVGGEQLRGQFGGCGQSNYGQPHPYGMSPQDTGVSYLNYISSFGSPYQGTNLGYGTFSQSFGMHPQTGSEYASFSHTYGYGIDNPMHQLGGYGNYISQFGGYGGQQQGYGRFGQTLRHGVSPQTPGNRSPHDAPDGFGRPEPMPHPKPQSRQGRDVHQSSQSTNGDRADRSAKLGGSGPPVNMTAAQNSASRANIGNFSRRPRPSPYRMAPQTPRDQHSASPGDAGYFGTPWPNPYGMAPQTPRDQHSASPGDIGYFGTPCPNPYAMSPQTPRDQHSASQANVGGFGGASAKERGTNNGGYSTNNGGRLPTTYQPGPLDSANNGDYSPNNRGRLPTTYHPGPQGPQTNQTPPASVPLSPLAAANTEEEHSPDGLTRYLRVRYPDVFLRARVDDPESGAQDESSTVFSDDETTTGILTPTTTEAGDSEVDFRN